VLVSIYRWNASEDHLSRRYMSLFSIPFAFACVAAPLRKLWPE
jgi:hypothetical protein